MGITGIRSKLRSALRQLEGLFDLRGVMAQQKNKTQIEERSWVRRTGIVNSLDGFAVVRLRQPVIAQMNLRHAQGTIRQAITRI